MSSLTITDVNIPIGSLKPSTSSSSFDSHEPFCTQNIYIHDGVIVAVNGDTPSSIATIYKGDGYYALPGFMDIHVHGGMGVDAMDDDSSSIHQMAEFFAHHGVTSFCPTTMTAPHQQILQAVTHIEKARSSQYNVESSNRNKSGARILGTHVEGPYISPKFPGAQPAKYIRPPDVGEFRELLNAGTIRLVTLAPEQPGADELIRIAHKAGITVVLGHTNATYEECVTAVELGVQQATHTYNAMSGLHHRRPGALGATLSLDKLDAQLIADNIHVHPAAMKILSRCKGVDRTILITDAMRAAGLADGEYTLGGQVVTLKEGACRLDDGTLAGSILTMDQALINFMDATGYSLAEAWPTTSRTPARSLGLAGQFGTIAAGYWADLVLLDHAYSVVATIVGGNIVYQR